METVAATLLGVVQGLTEFLPVSSSGHLALVRALLPEGRSRQPRSPLRSRGASRTLAAALIFLRREVRGLARSLFPARGRAERRAARAGRRLFGLIAVATVPTAVAGVVFAEPIRSAFDGTAIAGRRPGADRGRPARFAEPPPAPRDRERHPGRLFRPGGGAEAPGAGAPPPPEDPPGSPLAASIPSGPRGVRDALFIGLAQAIAILPGVSRSGFTILAGLRRGLAPGDAARFSFLLSGSVIAGAAALEGASALSGGALRAAGTGLIAVELAAGFVAAFAAGTLALRWVFDWLARKRFHDFGWVLPRCRRNRAWSFEHLGRSSATPGSPGIALVAAAAFLLLALVSHSPNDPAPLLTAGPGGAGVQLARADGGHSSRKRRLQLLGSGRLLRARRPLRGREEATVPGSVGRARPRRRSGAHPRQSGGGPSRASRRWPSRRSGARGRPDGAAWSASCSPRRSRRP